MATPAEELDVDGVAVRLTSPRQGVLPPRAGLHQARCRQPLPGRGRPDGRAAEGPAHASAAFPPDGIEGEEIYQKRIPQKHPDYLQTCTVTFPSGRTADA